MTNLNYQGFVNGNMEFTVDLVQEDPASKQASLLNSMTIAFKMRPVFSLKGPAQFLEFQVTDSIVVQKATRNWPSSFNPKPIFAEFLNRLSSVSMLEEIKLVNQELYSQVDKLSKNSELIRSENHFESENGDIILSYALSKSIH